MEPVLGEHVKKVGNIDVFVRRNALRDYSISLYNGSDCVFSEVYFTSDVNGAINRSLMMACDIITECEMLKCCSSIEKLSQNTYRCKIVDNDSTNKQDWLCRIDNTEYFKHFYKSEDEFVADKDGKRIIDY